MTLRVDRIENTAATDGFDIEVVNQGRVKAWTAFHMSGTFGVDDSYMVSSMTDMQTGRAQANFTNLFSSQFYACAYSQQSSAFYGTNDENKFATHCSAQSYNYNGAPQDLAVSTFMYQGDLA